VTGLDATQIDRESALAALRWWVDAGVDVIAADTPRSWLSTAPPAEPIQAAPPVVMIRDVPELLWADPTPRPAPSTARNAHGDAATFARDADTPAALLAAAKAFAGPSALLYDGALESGVLFVTDAPSHDDAREGRLLTGDQGHLFDHMLAAIGLNRDRAGLASITLHAGGDPGEIALLRRLITLIRPHAIIALGGIAATRLTSDTRGLNRLRGQWNRTSSDGVMFPTLCTFHPSHLIANPHHKALAWADLLVLKAGIAR